MNSAQREEAKRKLMDEQVFAPLLEQTFKDADVDKSGFIEKDELTEVLKGLHFGLGIPAPTRQDVDKELKRLDTNKDGKISKDEFRVLVKEIALHCIDNL